MDENILQQIHDLALEVSCRVGRLDSTIDEVLLEARLLGQEIDLTRQVLFEYSQRSLKASRL